MHPEQMDHQPTVYLLSKDPNGQQRTKNMFVKEHLPVNATDVGTRLLAGAPATDPGVGDVAFATAVAEDAVCP